MLLFAYHVLHLMANSKKIRANAVALKRQNMETAKGVLEKVALATVEPAQLKAVAEELVSVKSKLAACHVKGANLLCRTQSVKNRTSEAY